MIDVFFLRIAASLYLISLLLSVLSIFFREKYSLVTSFRIVTFIGLTLHVLSFSARVWQSYELHKGYFPVVSMYESLTFFSMTVMFYYLFQRDLESEETVGFFVTLFVFLLAGCLAFASLFDKEMRPVLPSLKGLWLPIHALTCLIGYAGFTVAFILGIVYLMRNIFRFRSSVGLEDVVFCALDRSINVGVFFFTVGFVAGVIWAHYAWGAYWRWDPKEVGSLITLLVYVGYIHVDGLVGLSIHTKIFVVVLGFLCVVFTYFGVNYLSSVHVYHGM
ncbi:MAG: cytochrome c biogenesis protein CcsA [Syntrophales bacterium]|nr:cytochrome c biogenesis protein CcsA [Syntrophales bacterium]